MISKILKSKYAQMSIACAIVLVLSNFVAEATGLRFWQRGINTAAVRLYVMQRYLDDGDVIFLGSSRTEQGINAPTLQDELTSVMGHKVGVYAAGLPNANALVSEEIVQNVIQDAHKPKIVAVSVSLQDVFQNSKAAVTYYRYYASQAHLVRALPWISNDEEFEAVTYGFCRGMTSLELFFGNSPYISPYKKSVDEVIDKRGSHWREGIRATRWVDKPDKWEIIDAVLKAQGDLVADARFDGPAVLALDNILAEGKRRNIQIILFENPLLPEFFERFAQTKPYQDYKAFIRAYAKKNDVVLFDKTALELGLSSEDYLDPDHMHLDGARKFSALVAREVIAPELRKQGP